MSTTITFGQPGPPREFHLPFQATHNGQRYCGEVCWHTGALVSQVTGPEIPHELLEALNAEQKKQNIPKRVKTIL